MTLIREQLIRAQDRIAQLEATVIKLENDLDLTENSLSDVRILAAQEERYHLESEKKLAAAVRRAELPFARGDVEKLNRAQLLSVIEESVNEARRKGLLEAEALVQKHREHTEETDLEMMRGVVTTYQNRIAAVEADQKARKRQATAPVTLDKRPLAEKMQPAGFKAPKWWSTNSDFMQFDQRAQLLAKRPQILGQLANNQQIDVMGDSGIMYTIKRVGDVYSCSCPSWIHQRADSDRRTCKHLMRHLGDEAETKRVNRPRASCWCGVLMVRDQCQVHTNRWVGDERCNCGRLFSHCKEEYTSGRAPTAAWHEPRLQGTPEPERTRKARNW